MEEDAKEAVRRALPIEVVVGETVQLRRVGTRLVGLCPFHAERTPSFSVSPERGLWYCFGCHAGGDVFDFVMRRDGIGFAEALATLAAKAGITLRRADSPQDRHREELLRLIETAAAWYEAQLKAEGGRPVLAYLERRGVPRRVADRFRLGFSPFEGPSVVEALSRAGFRRDQIEEAGLVGRRGGSARELLRGRLIFPIRDRAGRVVAFAGRSLAEGQTPKYLNFPDTPLFRKRTLLYDLALARQALRDRGEAILVEGYMDVLALHAVGVEEVLAPMGTALGPEQVEMLARSVRRVVIAFDGDNAGREAAQRSLWLLAEAGVEVAVATLPPGRDPDDVARQGGAAAVRALTAAALPLTQFLVARALPEVERATPRQKAEVARQVLRGIFLLRDPVEQEGEVRRLAAALAVDEEALRREIRSMRRGRARGARGLEDGGARNTSRQRPLREEIEVAIINVLAKDPELAPQVTEPFVNEDAAMILVALQEGRDPAAVERDSARRLWAEACTRAPDESSSLAELLQHLRREGQRLRLDELRKEISRLEKLGLPIPQELIGEMMELLREAKAPREGGVTP